MDVPVVTETTWNWLFRVAAQIENFDEISIREFGVGGVLPQEIFDPGGIFLGPPPGDPPVSEKKWGYEKKNGTFPWGSQNPQCKLTRRQCVASFKKYDYTRMEKMT